jgi:polyisoprenoid-binding protein YceI
MNKVKLLIGTLTIFLASAFSVIVSIDWKVKDDYSVKAYATDKVQGYGISFKGLKSTISFDEENPEKSKISASIDATSIDTGNDGMTAHAKEAEALNTNKFPIINFDSKTITKTITGYEATGDLTIKGITKEIKFPFVFVQEIFRGVFTITPKDFNLTRDGVPEKMTIELIIPVTK